MNARRQPRHRNAGVGAVLWARASAHTKRLGETPGDAVHVHRWARTGEIQDRGGRHRR